MNSQCDLTQNRSYKKNDFSPYEYIIHNAIYVGSYAHMGDTSHRFLHIVKDESYMDFVGLWSHVCANSLVRADDITGAGVMYTDVYEHLMEKQGEQIIVQFPHRPVGA